MTETTISDAQQRQAALDTGTSFIVQAPAGSGKTELLTQRYLRLLAGVAHPEEILAITFTRKAAAEMRNRIVAALDAASGPQPEAAHERQTWALARAALERDTDLQWQITANPNRLRIQTFDSLSHALARQMPVLSELGASPGISESPDRHYQQAARATLQLLEDDALGPSIARLLSHLDNRQSQLETLLCTMLARRDQWLGHTLAAPDGTAIHQALEAAVSDHLTRLRQLSQPHWLHELVQLASEAAGHLQAANADAAPLTPWLERDQAPGSAWSDLPAWQGLAQLLLTKRREPRKSWDARIGFPPPGEKGLTAQQKAGRTQAKQAIKQLTAALLDDPELGTLWAGVGLLPAKGPDATQQAVLNSLFAVLLHAAVELQLVFQEAGEVDFAEIQMRAQRALGSPEQPTDLALSLDYRLAHLLVDEFQDTSSSQYQLLATLTAGWQTGDGRTLFAVGDPMQSIYRFREAEVGRYLAAWERGIGALKLVPLRLQVNFRSTTGIVDWINRSFPAILPSRVDVGRGAVPYSAAIAFDHQPDAAAVQVHPFANRDDAAEAETVVRLVRTALTETSDGRIAILARARSHLREIAQALKDAGLAFQAVDIDPLASRPVVRDLQALVRALLHPADRLAWLTVLHAPWVGLDLQDLLVIAENTARTIPGRLRDAQLRAALSNDGRLRVERLLKIIDRQLPARGRRPLRQWVERCWLMLGGLACAGSGGEADAQALLQLLDRHAQAGGLTDFAELSAAIDRLYAAPDSAADGRLQLMTMHKSKGLEFDTVILPGLGRPARGDSSELLYWLERAADDGQVDLLMAPIKAATQDAEPIADYLRELDKDKTRLETARLLYVAATRAKRRLHLLGHVNVNEKGPASRPTSGSLLEKLWPMVEEKFAALPMRAANDPGPPLLATLQRLPADWRPAADTLGGAGEAMDATSDSAPAIEFSWAGDTARHVGTLVHRQLERIADDGIEYWPAQRVDELSAALRTGLSNLGVDHDELDRATDKALRAIRQTLDDDTGRWILTAHPEARCEWPLTLHEDGPRHFVIDRTFVDEQGLRWIIDYKTGEHLEGDAGAFLDQEQERYRAQLETYGRLVSQLEARPIRLALYFPLFADWRVWDYTP